MKSSKKSKRKSKKSSKKSKSSKKTELDETKHDHIKDKPYITKEIETSITLLESPEDSIVLESLLFLSKYADIKYNNMSFIRAHGIMPKLLALLDHNICILRISLRLVSQLLTVDAARLELNQDNLDKDVLKICNLYVSHADINVKEFCTLILNSYSTLDKAELLLDEPSLLKAILKTIKSPENDVILSNSLQIFAKLLEIQRVRVSLPEQDNFSLSVFIEQMSKSIESFRAVLQIFEKMTYFGEEVLQVRLRECNIVEHMFNIIIDPEKSEHVQTCLNIVVHCMGNDNTNSYFIESLEFLKFCQWVKTCPNEVMLVCASIFLQLAKNDSIRQVLFDLSVEDAVLSFLRSSDKQVLNATCDCIAYLSKHKYCCEAMVTPVVIKKILEILQRRGDSEDPYNETALITLHYLCRRDSRTIHMIREYDGIDVLVKYLKEGNEQLSRTGYRRLLEIINMFVTNHQLQKHIISTDLFDVILSQTQNESDEICMRSLEIMINCLNHENFLDYFLLNKGSRVIIDKLSATTNDQIIRLLTIFIHNLLMNESVANELIRTKLLLVAKQLPDEAKYKNPLIQAIINLIYNMCYPIKFFETGRLDLTDRIRGRFYVINGPWLDPFPFLEVLELRLMSTMSTIYVVDNCERSDPEIRSRQCVDIHQQSSMTAVSATSITSSNFRCSIQYGTLSHDPYFPNYIHKVETLFQGVSNLEEKIKILAQFVNKNLCGSDQDSTLPDKLHSFKLHIECIKRKLGTNMIPIGYLRLGFHCERALLFKALADNVYIPTTFVKGRNKLYWNEVALIRTENGRRVLKMFVVDLMNNVGQLLPVGSRQCNVYCDIQ